MTLHNPLDFDIEEIRVFRPFPAQDPISEIPSKLTTISLNSNPSYQAVSYVYGDELDSFTIMIMINPCKPDLISISA